MEIELRGAEKRRTVNRDVILPIDFTDSNPSKTQEMAHAELRVLHGFNMRPSGLSSYKNRAGLTENNFNLKDISCSNEIKCVSTLIF